MNVRPRTAVPTPPSQAWKQAEDASISWLLLADSESASFPGSLVAHIRKMLADALRAATPDEYRAKRDEAFHHYSAVVTLLVSEASVEATVTPDSIGAVLDSIESSLNEWYRHRLEHSLNVSDNARSVLVNAYRQDAEVDGQAPVGALVLYYTSMLQLSWAVDAVLFAAEQHTTNWQLVDTIFEDLEEAADRAYVAASSVYDVYGAPDKEDQADDVGEWVAAECA